MVQRFLVAANHDLDKARHLLTTTLLWRHAYAQEMGTADRRAERLRCVDQYYTLGLYNQGQSRDKAGRTVWIERVGLSDCQVVTTEGTVYNNETLEETFIRAHVTHYLQALALHSERILIMDMEGKSKNVLFVLFVVAVCCNTGKKKSTDTRVFCGCAVQTNLPLCFCSTVAHPPPTHLF